MRSLSSGLMGALVVGIAVAGCVGEADARGGGGVGIAGGARAGSAVAHRGTGIGGRGSWGRRFASGDRFGRGFGFGRNRYGYGLGYIGWGYGGYGSGYGSPYAGSFGGYDPAPPTSIGIPASPVAPPAIYVLGGSSRTKASGTTVRGRQASRTLTARSSDATGESGVVSGGPRIIRVSR